jgi:hypothetical protein
MRRDRDLPLVGTWLPFLFLLACSPSPSTLTVPTYVPSVTSAPAAPARTFVWTTTGEGGPATTYVLSDQGELVARLPGIHIAAGGTEWTWQETAEPIATSPCEDGIEQPPGEGSGTRVRLVPSDTMHDPLALVVPPDTPEGANAMEHRARLLASMGPYLFVEESTYEYTCGAHGNSAVSFTVWNIDEKSTVDVLAELPNRERLLQAGKSAIDADPEAVDLSVDDEDPPALTELFPRLGPHGQVHATALVTVPSCYACTQGGWGSYTSSAPVAAELPPRLRKVGPPPSGVALFVDAHPELSIGGYSVAER